MDLLEAHQAIRDRINECQSKVTVAQDVKMSYGVLMAFSKGMTQTIKPAAFAALCNYFYPNWSIVLGEPVKREYIPPEGWVQHPQNTRYFYNVVTREVLTEEQLRARPAEKLAKAFAKVVAPPHMQNAAAE